MTNKTYLGDSVYAEMQPGRLILTTENELPDDPSNTIVLEEEVYSAMLYFVEQQTKDQHDDQDKQCRCSRCFTVHSYAEGCDDL